MFVTAQVTFSLFRNWVKISLIAFLFFMFISVEFLASLYVQGEQTYSIEDGEKIVSVIVDRTMYTLSPEAMKMFEDIHDDWELSICEKFPHDVLIGGIYTQIYILKAQYRHYALHPSDVVLVFTWARCLLFLTSILVANKRILRIFNTTKMAAKILQPAVLTGKNRVFINFMSMLYKVGPVLPINLFLLQPERKNL